MNRHIPRRPHQLALALMAMATVLIAGQLRPVTYAAGLGERAIGLASTSPSAITTHSYRLTVTSGSPLGSVAFEYCDNSPIPSAPCEISPGLDVTGAAIIDQAGVTGYSVQSTTTVNRLVLGAAAPQNTTGSITFEVSSIVNPSSSGTYYVRMLTYAATDGSGSPIDSGGVAYSIQEGISTQAYVPPWLIFCSGLSVALDCSSSQGSYIELGELVPAKTSYGRSQFSAATNDMSGYTVTLFGTTMLSGNNVIPPLTSPAASQPGVGQFGLNLRANAKPAEGEEIIGAGVAVVAEDYNQPDNFMFNSGDIIVSSPMNTEFNRATVTYIVNVASGQPAGIYTGTYTYVAVASF